MADLNPKWERFVSDDIADSGLEPIADSKVTFDRRLPRITSDDAEAAEHFASDLRSYINEACKSTLDGIADALRVDDSRFTITKTIHPPRRPNGCVVATVTAPGGSE